MKGSEFWNPPINTKWGKVVLVFLVFAFFFATTALITVVWNLFFSIFGGPQINLLQGAAVNAVLTLIRAWFVRA